MRPVAAWVLALAVSAASASDFGWARIRAASRPEPYGAVTFRPFSSGRGAVLPLFILVEPGDFAKPWLRAKHVAQLLPKAVELMVGGDEIKVGADADGNPALYVGAPGRTITRADLQLVSVLPGDVQRFRREKGETRRLGAGAIANHWKALFDDVVTVFVRFPLARDAALAERLHLGRTRAGVQLKRIIVEAGVLLKYEDLTLDRATVTQVKRKTLEVLDAMPQEQWAQLADLAFRVPADDPTAPAPEPSPSGIVPLPPPLPEDGEPSAAPGAVPLYVEPDRSVWPGGSAAPPSDEQLRTSGQNATKGVADPGVEDPTTVVTP